MMKVMKRDNVEVFLMDRVEFVAEECIGKLTVGEGGREVEEEWAETGIYEKAGAVLMGKGEGRRKGDRALAR
jgi:hypothetical protein